MILNLKVGVRKMSNAALKTVHNNSTGNPQNPNNLKPDWTDGAMVNIAIAMAALLVTTSAVTLPMMASVTSSNHKYLNDIFWLVGLGSIVTSALLIDWVLDKAKFNFKRRLGLMGGGYVVFALLVSLISVAVTAQFFVLEVGEKSTSVFSFPFLVFLFGGLSIFIKVMTEDDHYLASGGILLFFSISYMIIACDNIRFLLI
ncbi:hypothetical protein [Pseudoalteromonas rubra]|uniref:hypothetical protein n=1 Tax=Pseudoalteromonas rubra TaxID=43658 RepID=UPI00026C988D|nr:hypothetical protein [Pseudoalteromonas rubra]